MGPNTDHVQLLIHFPFPRRLWIHPRTQERVKILGGAKASAKALKELGYDLAELPDFIGGGKQGIAMIDLIKQAVARQKAGETEEPRP